MTTTMTCLCGTVHEFPEGVATGTCAGCGLGLVLTEERVECQTCHGGGVVRAWSLSVDRIDDHDTCPDCMGEGTVPRPAGDATPAAPVEPVSTAYVEAMVTEAVCTWLPAILRRYPENVRNAIPWRSVDVDSAHDLADRLFAARELLGGREAIEREPTPEGATSTVSGLRAIHDTLHAANALATMANAVERRSALVCEILRRLAPVYRTADKADHAIVKSAWSMAMEYLG